jgi:arylsulfatase
VTLYADGEKVGDGKIGATAPMIFSADDGCDVGCDTGAPVSQDYGAHGNDFNGSVRGVEIAIAATAMDADHMISPMEAVRVALARQ